jgi:hypothetical protein
LNQIITTMAISYVLSIFFFHGSVRPACISSRKAEQKGDFFSHISCL